MIYLIILILSFSSLHANESVLSAVFSLKCYFEQQQDPSEDDILFEDGDIAQLWEKASLSNDLEILSLRKGYETDSDSQLLEKKLTSIWNRLNPRREIKEYSQYLLPSKHPLKPHLDAIFHSSRATQNREAMIAAGFSKLYPQPLPFMCVAFHPNLPGFLLKMYFDDETRMKDGIPGWTWLVQRCHGAQEIRKIIKKKNIKYFTVPDKYLYELPDEPAPILLSGTQRQQVVLVETDMDLVSHGETLDAWKNKITHKHLDELYCILCHGYGSAYVGANIPFTKNGMFACIDTEYPKRKLKYHQVKLFLSEPMSRYWDSLVKKGGK